MGERKPLGDISNGNCGRSSSNPPGDGDGDGGKQQRQKISVEEEEEEEQQQEVGDEGVLDRLLLAHSDLSKLIHQIDELVVKALKVRGTSNRD